MLPCAPWSPSCPGSSTPANNTEKSLTSIMQMISKKTYFNVFTTLYQNACLLSLHGSFGSKNAIKHKVKAIKPLSVS